jgi:uncharacterized protein (DUF433 family)
MTSASSLKTPLMDWSGCAWVESVEGRLSGVPVVMGTRMQADGVLENFDDGLSVEEICYHFFLDEYAVRGVLAFAGRLQAADAP